jgi:hypothetical protein
MLPPMHRVFRCPVALSWTVIAAMSIIMIGARASSDPSIVGEFPVTTQGPSVKVNSVVVDRLISNFDKLAVAGHATGPDDQSEIRHHRNCFLDPRRLTTHAVSTFPLSIRKTSTSAPARRPTERGSSTSHIPLPAAVMEWFLCVCFWDGRLYRYCRPRNYQQYSGDGRNSREDLWQDRGENQRLAFCLQ